MVIWLTFLIYISRVLLIENNPNDQLNKNKEIEPDYNKSEMYSKEDYNHFFQEDKAFFIQTPSSPVSLEPFTKKSLTNGESILNDILLNKNTFIIHNKVLEIAESDYYEMKLAKAIKKIMQIKEVKYPLDYVFYGYPMKIINENYPWPSLLLPSAFINDYSIISNQIVIDPEMIVIESKICIASISLIKIKNFSRKNMIIRGVKSDLYQVKLFLYKNGKENLAKINTHFPRTISPNEDILLQLVSLSDETGVINGSLYIELNNNKIIIVPIVIQSKDNAYHILPLFIYSWTKDQKISKSITVYNPDNSTFIINEVIHSFNDIHLYWTNGLPLSTDISSLSSSILEIQPKTLKTIINVKFNKVDSGVEYGILQLNTNKEIFLIPIFVQIELRGFKSFPSSFNFGLIDLNSAIKLAIPLSVLNLSKDYLSFNPLYTNYDEHFITFYPISYTQIVIAPNETLDIGYAVFDPFNYHENSNDHLLFNHISGSFFIETNYTKPYSIGEIEYSYMLDKGTFTHQFKYGIQLYSKDSIGSFDMITKIKSPFNVESIPEQFRKWTPFYKDNNIKVYIKKVKYGINSNNAYFAFKVLNATKILNSNLILMPILLSQHLYSILHIRLFNDTLDFLYCNNKHSFHDCFHSNHPSIYQNINKYNSNPLFVPLDLGIIPQDKTVRVSFYIINAQSTLNHIKDIESDHNALSITLLRYEEFNDKNSSFSMNNNSININWINTQLSNKIRNKAVKTLRKNELNIEVYPHSVAVFNILIHSNEESTIKGIIDLYVNSDSRISFEIRASVLKGSLNLTPSIIRFEPGFPGLFQHKYVSSKSNFKSSINIISVKSSDQRIIPEILQRNIYPNDRTEILKITFDSSRVSTDLNYMKGNYSMSLLTDSSKTYLTYKDLYLWRDKQKLWERLGSEGKTELNAVLTIKTSVHEEEMPVRAFLTKPSLVKKDEINFGLVQIGETADAYIEGFNPSDEMIYYQLLLANEEYSDIYNDNNIFNKNKGMKDNPLSKVIVFDCIFLNNTKRSRRNYYYQNRDNHQHNIIIIEEDDIDYENIIDKSYSKKELMMKLYMNSNNSIRQLFLKSKQILCSSQLVTKNSIILSNNTFLSNILFSNEFRKEIDIIKQMTEREPDFLSLSSSSSQSASIENITLRIIKAIKGLVSSLFPLNSINSANETKTNTNQSQLFYLPHQISSQTFYVHPHQKFKIGPILYHPTSFTQSSSTLFIKNNLTILYPIKLFGKGGNGISKFTVAKHFSPNFKLIGSNKVIIEIDREIFENEMFNKKYIERQVTLTNMGTLPLKISNITVDHLACEKFWLKISQCTSITLEPNGSIDINIEINPDFNFYMIEKEIFFESQYQYTSLKVVVNINKDLLMIKNKLFNYDYTRSYGLLSLVISLFICFSILKIVAIEKEVIQTCIVYKLLLLFNNYESNEEIKFANLIIKAYRKNDKDFIENFIKKQIDKPGSVDIEGISSGNNNEKRKSIKKKLKSPGSKVHSGNSKTNSDASSIRKLSKEVNESNDNKKDCFQCRNKDSKAKFNNYSNNRIGNITINANVSNNKKENNQLQKIKEKREEKVNSNINQANDKISIKDQVPISNTAKRNNDIKEEIYQPKFNNNSHSNRNNNIGYYYNANKCRQKNKSKTYYGNSYYNNKKKDIWKHDHHYYYQNTNANYDNYQPQITSKHHFNSYNHKNKFNILPSNLSTENLSTYTQQSDQSSENQSQLNSIKKPIDSKTLISENNSYSKSSSIQDQDPYQYQYQEPKQQRDMNEDNKQTTSAIINQNTNQRDISVSQSNNNTSTSNPITQNYIDNKEKENQMASIGAFDFSNIFLKNSNDNNYNHTLDSEGCDLINGQNQHQTDSGFEDFKYNIGNMMVSNNNSNHGLYFSGNECTDEELKDQPNKPYFKSIINENFDNKVFYTNPFNNHQHTKGTLTELIDEEENENEMINPIQIDGLAEGEEGIDEDEEEPLWNSEQIDINKEGYFDERGYYKIKQMDFNFNLI